jgi:hypothetical protein
VKVEEADKLSASTLIAMTRAMTKVCCNGRLYGLLDKDSEVSWVDETVDSRPAFRSLFGVNLAEDDSRLNMS